MLYILSCKLFIIGVIFLKTVFNMTAKNFYEVERSNNSGNICTHDFCNDTVIRKKLWIGKIGLVSTSDYAYATKEQECLSVPIYNWEENLEYCKSNNWLMTDYSGSWTMNACADNISCYTFCVLSSSFVRNSNAKSAYKIYPVVYLKSNVEIINGVVTGLNPFELSLSSN